MSRHTPDDALSAYRAKRDFAKTPEPSGRRRLAPGEHPRFVIQRHAARRLHYDLRLEVDGVYKSWAVTKGPSLDPGEKRLAVEVEDHPLDYGDFEGTIPKGEYGGGTVLLWDRGYWLPQDGQSPSEALQAGELKFVLAGEKLEGGWVLVRLKSDREKRGRNNWLLIKHRDPWARPSGGDAILRKDRSVVTGRTMNQIAAAGERYVPLTDARKPAEFVSEKPARPRSPAATRKISGITLSNSTKILWPDAGEGPTTKLDLAEYFEAVSNWMLPHIAGRPCSIVRTPDGIDGERFFQRHAMPRTSPEFTRVRVPGESKPYLQIDSEAGLIAAAQLAALELHPWNCAPGAPAKPGRLVFDLDPGPDVGFDTVIAAAIEMRARLEALGLVTFCKTTGGKGLHVVTPLAPEKRGGVGWEEAKTFALSVCMALAHDHPDRYLMKMTKSLRKGRIFLDYLRNDRTATTVAVLSPRARPGAPVSMPLDWSRVRPGLDPSKFTIRTAPQLLARSKPWQDYDDGARSLVAAIKRHVKP